MAHDEIIKCIEILNNDKLASGGEDQLIKVWDRSNYKLLNTLEGHYSTVTALKYHNASRVLVSGGEDRIIIVWKYVPLLQKVYVLKGHEDNIIKLAFENERTLISSGKDKKLIVWDIERGIRKKKLD